MTWVIILGIAGAVFAIMASVLRMPRAGWEITGAALLFGIAGYALQGHPDMPGAPKAAVENQKVADAELIKQRQQMGAQFGKGQSWLIVSDALTRAGQYRAAADFLGRAVQDNPRDADLWVALGNALIGHSEGMISPAAQFAFRRAAQIDPNHPGPPFFMGLALAQSGKLNEARDMWVGLLRRAPADAPYRPDLVARLARLDQIIAMSNGGTVPEATPSATTPQPLPKAAPTR
ncbi:tetratricopeptide TPR_4 [Novosphingobium nitrogenifigens DSM 19370]|uniref:Tetratricopeptide TPR_4 n=1 Tax=Novosphingobium nitrogenifigens DSM 19370 TaxID=983920 RepID=F1ZCJ4_9SPHN|nr:tetratricopeptide repeat protein [Novosphingobium nitrogenifigens]EGD57724.1 tetratricopeptide TPR_4 [Novosphingobium nitrogenifigens DSM 19370]